MNTDATENLTADSVIFDLPDEQATEWLGALLASSLDGPILVGLSGDLGAGKTTLTRGFLRYCGYHGAAKSPTFTLVESYDFDSLGKSGQSGGRGGSAAGLHHFDLYRIADPEELDFIGFDEYLEDECDVIVEWPELGGDRFCGEDFYVHLSHRIDARQARLEARSERARSWLKNPLNKNKFRYLNQ